MIAELGQSIKQHVDWIAYLITILGGLTGKYRLKGWKLDNGLKTFLIGTGAITAYAIVLQWSGTFVKTDAPRLFFGYILATGLYPITIKYVENWLKKKFGVDLNAE